MQKMVYVPPLPETFKVVDKGSDYIKLYWNKIDSDHPIEYKVFMFKGKKGECPPPPMEGNGDNGWKMIYKGGDSTFNCYNLESQTWYTFAIRSICNGETSPECKYCSKKTSTKLWKKIAIAAAGIGVAIGAFIATVATGGIAAVGIIVVGGIELEAVAMAGIAVSSGVVGSAAVVTGAILGEKAGERVKETLHVEDKDGNDEYDDDGNQGVNE